METGSTSRLWSMHNLPDDLWLEIFPRLPVKSLLRFRCVSKSWQALIDDPGFTRSHLSCFNNNNCLEYHLFLFKEPTRPPFNKFLVWCTENPKANLEVELPQISPSSPNQWYIVSFIDGVFILKKTMILRTPEDIMLWNPSIRKTLILPPYPETFPQEMKAPDLGLGFDPSIKDYKYIRYLLIPGMPSVAIYSLGSNSWRMIEFQGDPTWPMNFSFHLRGPTICLRGALYSLAMVRDFGLSLVSFDLITEVFASIKCPVQDRYPLSLTMADEGRSLGLIAHVLGKISRSRSVWVLEGLGGDVKSWSWSKRYDFAAMGIPKCNPRADLFHIGKNGEVFFESRVVVKSYRGDQLRGKAWPYMESLVLLK